jgi:hypothetical protein
MNTNAAIAVMNLRKWCASLRPTKIHPAHPVRVRILKRKSRLLPRLEVHPAGQAILPAAVAVPVVALLDQGNFQTGREPVFFFLEKDDVIIQYPDADGYYSRQKASTAELAGYFSEIRLFHEVNSFLKRWMVIGVLCTFL